jgi:CO dehydrogenase nickel-insertion accessory protein CooC1
LRAGDPPATRHLADPALAALARRLFSESTIRGVLVVLNRIPDPETEHYLRRRLAAGGLEPIGVVREHPELARSALRGVPLDWTVARAEAMALAERLEAAASAARSGTPTRSLEASGA